MRTRIFFAAGLPTLSGVYDDTQARIGDTVNLRLLLGNAPQWSWQSAAFQLDLPPNTTLGTPTTSCSSAIVSIVSRTLSFTNGSLSTANLSCPVTVPVTFTSAGLYSTTTQDASAYVIRDTGTLTQRPLGASVNASVEVQAEAIFNANSGVGAMPPQLSAVAANLIPNTFTRDGFTFAGWNTAANGSGAPYGDGAVFPFTVDDTLYAQWRSVTPPPVYPPGAPLDVQASAGDGSATVTWTAPSYAGSFPITDYRVTSFPGGQSCLVEAPATSCTVSGLTNGTTYTFTVEALNGAGWGEPSLPSNAVTPSAGVVRLVLNQGVRFADGRNDRIRTTGSSVGIPDGSRLTPYIKYTGSDEYKRGKATIVVKADGTYTWTRKIRKNRGVTAYVQWLDVRSNTVFWAKLT